MRQNVIWALFIGQGRETPPSFISWWEEKPPPEIVLTVIANAVISPSHMTIKRTEELILKNEYRVEGELCYYFKRLIEGKFKDI